MSNLRCACVLLLLMLLLQYSVNAMEDLAGDVDGTLSQHHCSESEGKLAEHLTQLHRLYWSTGLMRVT